MAACIASNFDPAANAVSSRASVKLLPTPFKAAFSATFTDKISPPLCIAFLTASIPAALTAAIALSSISGNSSSNSSAPSFQTLGEEKVCSFTSQPCSFRSTAPMFASAPPSEWPVTIIVESPASLQKSSAFQPAARSSSYCQTNPLPAAYLQLVESPSPAVHLQFSAAHVSRPGPSSTYFEMAEAKSATRSDESAVPPKDTTYSLLPRFATNMNAPEAVSDSEVYSTTEDFKSRATSWMMLHLGPEPKSVSSIP
mmetsp:Transcript_20793/g.68759  ORF Transcript_20793/g.68759 Transcript_20793/m.68759 type:complete len:255 (+) Transcript_20793:4171-4935(+)